MARIENVNIDGTDYDVGKIASTSNLGVVQVGSGLSITPAGVLSTSGGNEMVVSLTPLQGSSEFNYTWTSDYTYEQLASNPSNIRMDFPDEEWFCIDEAAMETLVPDTAYTVTHGEVPGGSIIYWGKEFGNLTFFVGISAPHEESGQTVQGCYLNISRTDYRDPDNKHMVNYTELPMVTLASGVTDIPDGTTIELNIGQDEELRGRKSSDCEPRESFSWGNFIVLPVKRVFGSSVNNATEYCLITETSTRSGSAPASYRYKSFWSNGVKYKLTYTSSTGSNYIWTITKVPVGTTYTAGTGINISNGVISCTLADANSVSY